MQCGIKSALTLIASDASIRIPSPASQIRAITTYTMSFFVSPWGNKSGDLHVNPLKHDIIAYYMVFTTGVGEGLNINVIRRDKL